MERRDTVEKVKKSLETTVSMFLMASTGLTHLNKQIETPMDVVKLHELNANLETELRTTLTSDFLDKVVKDENYTDILINYINDIDKTRRSLLGFIKHVNK